MRIAVIEVQPEAGQHGAVQPEAVQPEVIPPKMEQPEVIPPKMEQSEVIPPKMEQSRVVLLWVMLLWLALPVTGVSQLTVRIFTAARPEAVIFTAESGPFTLSDGSTPVVILTAGEPVVIEHYAGRVTYMTRSGRYGTADSLTFMPASDNSLFMLRVPGEAGLQRRLTGQLTISSFPGSLMILNTAPPEEFLPGIVRAEAGRLGPSEYFRAQAVVARTYLYRNMERHALDGHNMCDDVHCQVYPGVVTDSIIVNACRTTAGLVLVDGDSLLIEAAFHGNCGGVTASSAGVWLAGYPYLVSVEDPWCSYSASARWKASVTIGEWNSFLRAKGITPGTEGGLYGGVTESGRVYRYSAGGKSITGEEIRVRFGLRSAWFVMRPQGDSLIFDGRGYGHGVGLCQDGARHMAEKKVGYEAITRFYYPGTAIVDIKYARRPVRL